LKVCKYSNGNKTGNVRIKVTLGRGCVNILAVEKQ